MHTKHLWLSLVPLALASCPASAQTAPDAPKQTDYAIVELADQPFRLESAGLTMYLPLGAIAQTTRLGEHASVKVTPPTSPGQHPKWIMNIQVVRTTNPDATTEWLADNIIDQLRASAGRLAVDVEPGAGSSRRLRGGDAAVARTSTRLITRDSALRVNEHVADRSYLVIPDPGGRPVVHGNTIFRVAKDRFVTFELIASEPNFIDAKPVYETTVATAEFVDPTEAATRRLAAIEAGRIVLDRLTESDYAAVIDGSAFGAQPGARHERWERLFTPGNTGRDADDTEHGYKRVQTWVGYRGEMEPKRNPDRWTPLEREQGYLLTMKTRLIQPTAAGNQLVDSEATFFMSIDRKREAWTIRMGLKSPDGSTALWKETGARDGAAMTISVEEPGSAPRTIKPIIQGDGYVSRLEAFILPQLLVRTNIPTDFGFYAYQPSLQTIAFRTDRIEQPASMPGRFRLTTRLAEDLAPQTSVFEASGQLLATTLPDGRIWQPVTLKKLFDLWKRKDLPLD